MAVSETIQRGLATLALVSAAAASQLPGISYFTRYAPPSAGLMTLLSGGLTVAILVWVFTRKRASVGLGKGVVSVVAAVLLAIGYGELLDWVTVPAPGQFASAGRFQIGFGTQAFSLTEEAEALRRAGHDTPQELMMAKAAFHPDGPKALWEAWTIVAASIVLKLTFVVTYILWAFGLAIVARALTMRIRA